MDRQERPIRVAVVGMDQRMRHALHMLFQGPCKNRCTLVEEHSAEITIIDLDAYQGKQICDEYKNRHPEMPLIVISLHNTEIDNAVFLHKPLNAKQLMSALSKAKQTIHAAPEQPKPIPQVKPTTPVSEAEKGIEVAVEIIDNDTETGKAKPNIRNKTHQAAISLGEQNAKVLVGTAPDIEPGNSQQLIKAQYNPKNFLQDYIQRACRIADNNNRCVRLNTSHGSIDIFPDGHGAILKFSEAKLRSLSVLPVIESSLSVSVLEAGHIAENVGDFSTISREALIWKTALWASRGRLPVGTSFDTPVCLTRWPNMTRLLLFPHVLRITAFWMNQPHSLLDTATALAIPQRHVFGLYSATHAIGLASTGMRVVDTLIKPAPQNTPPRHSLLGRILKHLRKK